MDAAAERLEFAPPPQPGLLRSFGLAVVAHLLLLVALIYGFHWQREAQQDAVEAELWSSIPQQAAPKPVPTPPVPAPQPQPKPEPVAKAPPEPQVNRDAEIALERDRQKKALEEQQRREEQARLEAQKKREQELAQKREEDRQKKLQEQKLADAKRKEEEQQRKLKQQQQAALDAKKREQLREDTLKRMQAMAGTGAPNAQGNAAHSAGPSGSWAGKVQARVRPNIVFTDDLPGNPTASVQVRLGPGGMILGKPQLVKSSGSKAWDDAVVRALEKTETLPPDVDGRYPSPVVIDFKPKA